MKKYIIVTGGAGFVGSNLIELLVRKTKFQIISLDNYSSGSKKNHIKDKRVEYINCHTSEINKKLSNKKKKFIHFFILENLLEYLKVLIVLMIALNQTLLDHRLYLNFA